MADALGPIHQALNSGVEGSTNPYINFGDIAKFEFALPPLDQQRCIAEILQTTDALGRAWAKASTTVARYAESRSEEIFRRHEVKGHQSATQACEEITVGIVVKPASHYTDAPSGIAALRSLNVFPGRFDLDDLVYLNRSGHHKHAKSHLRTGDVVVVRTGRPGDAAVVTPELAGMNLIDLILVRPKQHLLPDYLVAYLNSATGRRKIFRGAAGTAQQHFNVSEFQRLSLPVPPLAKQRAAVESLSSINSGLLSCEHHEGYLRALQAKISNVLLA